MENSCHVWGRENYRKRLLVSRREIIWIKVATFEPPFIYSIFGVERGIGL
jgi:hypothetical protein